MPGFYPENEYDVAGYSTGIVDKNKIIDRSKLKEGDVIIGLASSGLHSNGFSLVRKIFGVSNKNTVERYVPELGKTLGEELLTPTEIYVKPVLELVNRVQVKAISHITGGGFYENIPRSLTKGKTAKITKSSYEIPPVFKYLSETGNIPERDMYNTFNMGVGMVCVVAREDADKAAGILCENGTNAFCIGEIINSDDGVLLV
jgi:phosphoribosylformylglycinamidine cyclo-ligase